MNMLFDSTEITLRKIRITTPDQSSFVSKDQQEK